MGEVLARYIDDKAASIQSTNTLIYSVQALAPFWGNLTCDAVRGTMCRAYESQRAKPRTITQTTKTGRIVTRTLSASASTVRRELGVLQAALNHAHDEGLLVYPIAVALPAGGKARDRWLTQDEVARLIEHAEPHIQRFILLAVYTGRRAAAILDLIWARVDLEVGVIRFQVEGEAETNKRRGRVRIPRQLSDHLRSWQGVRGTHVVMYRGKPVVSVRTGIKRAAERAGIEGVTPHVLKHTAITWGVMDGMSLQVAAEYFDTSAATINKHYWHHSPHHQAEAVEIIERRQ